MCETRPPQPRRATTYLLRLLLLIPAGAMAALGWWKYSDVPTGGSVNAIKLTVKPGPVGQVREAYEGLVAAGYALDTLSMGMSGDLEAAILEGATIVRVGTALFGERTRKHA